jgi:xanthine dehydrogenase accessory factor
MPIFGAVDSAAALAQAGRFLGCHVTVCDARPLSRGTGPIHRPTLEDVAARADANGVHADRTDAKPAVR